ncbi:exopolygalacturonase-like [Malania oleifera]|uniref:exopolygalacturonase-like n=1 Tax=Malania oleifera TaxID=397392 RepID=UPI0025AE3CB3|nr:exopolygalacturonase-like [Malania oleifera]
MDPGSSNMNAGENRPRPSSISGGDTDVDIEETLFVLPCTDEQKVVFAAFKLIGEAKRQWRSARLIEEQRLVPIPVTWDQFKELLFERYFPTIIRSAKAVEFVHLEGITREEEEEEEELGMGLRGGLVVLVVLCLVHGSASAGGPLPKVFNIRDYGAIGDGQTDNAKAFSNAWTAACQWNGKSRVYVPFGSYLLSSAVFKGPCNGPISFRIQGLIKARRDLLDQEVWINFRYVNRLVIGGGGTIDGQGSVAWSNSFCRQSTNCRSLPLSLGLDFVTNSRVRGIRSVNSKNTHINLFGCDNVNITQVRITAPDDSPNTDGIRIGSSTRITIAQSFIGTGDDCVSMLSGNQNILVSQVTCAPGHGISVGSLGKYQGEANVNGITVERCTFIGTQNGVRIKTWADSASSSLASNFLFENIEMRDVLNPIIIDQEYCPYPPCPAESSKQVQIRDVTFRNIWGRSKSRTAVFLRCSKTVPCKNLKMEDINLAYFGPGGPANSSCSNALGAASGLQNPRICI